MTSSAMNILQTSIPYEFCPGQYRQTSTLYKATAAEVLNSLADHQNNFVHYRSLRPEPHIHAWQKYLSETEKAGIWPTLRRRLVQLQFPIAAGISCTPEYRASIYRGETLPAKMTGLQMSAPWQLRLSIYQSWAGLIPIISTVDRSDFEKILQALAYRNEPQYIPATTEACMVSGFNNWDRLRAYRTEWEAQRGNGLWFDSWQRLQPKKSLFQDRFLILNTR
jgi:hypothetical protein